MSIDKAIIGFLGSIAASVAAARASRSVPPQLVADPGSFFQRLVALRGETEMKRHAERLAVHILGECKAGRASLDQMETRIVTLTGIACNFPPKTAQLQEELERSRGRSPAASALLIASSMVSRAQARGRPDQARVDPSWATDLIAEALSPYIGEPALLAGVERAFAAALEGTSAVAPAPLPQQAQAATAPTPKPAPVPIPVRPTAMEAAAPPPAPAKPAEPDFNDAIVAEQLRSACREHNISEGDVEPVVSAKTAQLRDLYKTLSTLGPGRLGSRLAETTVAEAATALGAGRLGRTAELLNSLVQLGMSSNRAMVSEALVWLGQLLEARLESQAAALAYGDAYKHGAHLPAPMRWSFALRHGAALASSADDLNRAGFPSTAPLSEAARVYASAIQTLPRDGASELYTVTQNCLGNTLLRLGEIEAKAEYFEHAGASYKAAAAAMDKQRSPRDWALVHSNLGTALLKAGEIAHAERNYGEAAAAYDAALTILKSDTATADWAAAEAGRGMAMGRLGSIRGDLGILERTARAVDAALATLERTSAPAPWARLQSCLGNICADLGERIGGQDWLERAITAYEAAQEEWTEDRAPLQWALSEANRGGAQLGLGTLTGSKRHLQAASETLSNAERMFIRLGHGAYATAARQSLQTVRRQLAQPDVPVPLGAETQAVRARV